MGGEIGFWSLLRWGWSRPRLGRWRIWHARRDIEILIGLLLRSLLRQPWRVVFTSAAPKRPGWWLRQLIRRCDAVIATSPRSAAFLERCDAVIFHGVDCEQFHPAADRQGLLAEVGLADQQVIGSFGRIRPSKGTDLFVDALLTVLPRFPDWTAVITGLCQQHDLPYLEAMQQRIAAAGLQQRIHFVGDLESADIRRWYQRSRICVAASRREGFGLTPLEAMATGCVPVTSEAGAWPWIIQPNFGAMFQTGSASSLASQLSQLLTDMQKLDRLASASREVACQHYSVQREASRVNQIYFQLATNSL
ncbi:glycosyltransferase family 4 protein [Cyanobium sp. Aljojuca 7D2]|uniref:glycosyltransferase family 4 protein n=1 Tax=Cyanobium sp. Aljojuca 7D2 TaxID=2823698 RepID=UPI0020CE645B|nr:glycosyltransferase family 4 protein [Cyanobium sp. Aljojuca 7D2]